jgi:ABC-2 type transport system ATP-binding protein
MPKPVIKIINVNKRFGKKNILRNINLEIESGEIFGIIGMSGSGKTTLLNTIIGFLQPEIGDVLFKIEHLLSFKDDSSQFRSVFTNKNEVKTIFGFATQNPSIYSNLTSVQNLDYFGKLYNLPSLIRKTNIEILLNLMNIYDSKDIPAGHLSGGMKKRLDIACSLIHDPKVLILDEPTADLDPLMRKQMWSLIKDINKKGTTIILSSHFLEELEHFCDRVCILYDSEIIITGIPNDVKKYYTKEQKIKIEISTNDYTKIIKLLEEQKTLLGISEYKCEGAKLIVHTSKAEVVLRKLLSIIKDINKNLIDVTVEDPSLESVLEMIATERKS